MFAVVKYSTHLLPHVAQRHRELTAMPYISGPYRYDSVVSHTFHSLSQRERTGLINKYDWQNKN